jgi:hypothetical protein
VIEARSKAMLDRVPHRQREDPGLAVSSTLRVPHLIPKQLRHIVSPTPPHRGRKGEENESVEAVQHVQA